MKKRFRLLSFFIAISTSVSKYHSQSLNVDTIIDYEGISFQTFGFDGSFIPDNGEIYTLSDLVLTRASAKSTMRYDLRRILENNVLQSFELLNPFVFDVSDSILVFRNENIVVFGTIQDTSVSIRKVYLLRNPPGLQEVLINYPKTYFGGISNVNPKSIGLSSGYLELDLSTGEELKVSVEFPFLALTHFKPYRYLQVLKSGYLIADPFDYSLRIYDVEGILKDSFICSSKHFNRSKEVISGFPRTFNHTTFWGDPSRHFPRMHRYLADKDRLWLVFLINDSTAFTRVGRNSLKDDVDDDVQIFEDHIWTRKAGKWKLKFTKSINEFQFDSDRVERSDIWPYFIPGSKLICKEGFLYYMFWASEKATLPGRTDSFYGVSERDRKKLHLRVVRFSIR